MDRLPMRYLIHCLLITLGLGVILLLAALIFNLELYLSMVITYVICSIFYSVPISFIAVASARPIEISFPCESDEEMQMALEHIREKCKKVAFRNIEVDLGNNTYEFVRNNAYLRWLTIPVKASFSAGRAALVCPIEFKKEFASISANSSVKIVR